jgi:hypothetical protein
MEKECGCFKKSDYENNLSFDNLKDAYTYAKTVAEFMNEEFCGQHNFEAHRGMDNTFIISVKVDVEAITGMRKHITCDTGCGSTDTWSLEEASKSKLD